MSESEIAHFLSVADMVDYEPTAPGTALFAALWCFLVEIGHLIQKALGF